MDQFAIRDAMAQSQQPIMNTIRGHLKIDFCDQYLWPPTAAAPAKCLKRPASLWVEDEAVPLGGVVAVVLAESPD